jgi:glutaryl-CoA dehydrogenase
MSPRPPTTRVKPDPMDLAGIDDLPSSEEKAVRAAVRQVSASSVDPHIASQS